MVNIRWWHYSQQFWINRCQYITRSAREVGAAAELAASRKEDANIGSQYLVVPTALWTWQLADSLPIWKERPPQLQATRGKELLFCREFRCWCNATTLSCYMTTAYWLPSTSQFLRMHRLHATCCRVSKLYKKTDWFLAKLFRKRSVSWTGNRTPIPADGIPAVAMIGWRVARLLGCGLKSLVGANMGVINQNWVDVQAISNLAIGFPLCWNYKLS